MAMSIFINILKCVKFWGFKLITVKGKAMYISFFYR